jgi:streptogramin lyase
LFVSTSLLSIGYAPGLVGADRRLEPVVVAGSSAGGNGAPLITNLKDPEAIAFGKDGRLYVADRGEGQIVVLDLAAGRADVIKEPMARGGGPARPSGWKCGPTGVQYLAPDPDGGVVFATSESYRVCRWDPVSGLGRVVAGTYTPQEFGGDGGPATQASLRVHGLACDAEGNVYVLGANRIRRISRSTGVIQTIAGTGKVGFFGDGGPAVTADLAYPEAIAIGRDGTIYFSDGANNRIRAIDRKGIIRTVAGNGRSGPPEDGDALRYATGHVMALAVDADGDVVFVTEAGFVRRLIVARGVLETFTQDLRWPELPHPREAAGVAAATDGSILYVVPRSKQVLSLPGALVRKDPKAAEKKRP